MDFRLGGYRIPGACGLHGYVGFLFGSLKSREWWSSDMMPIIFLFSAIISGTALVIVLYVVSCLIRKVRIAEDCIKLMAYTLWGFVMFTLVMELAEFGNLVYKGREESIRSWNSSRPGSLFLSSSCRSAWVP